MAEWVHAQKDPAEELAQLYYFSFKKRQPEGEIEFVITVKEFASRNAMQMRFYAQADKEVNQRDAPFRPFGWGDSLLVALSEWNSIQETLHLSSTRANARALLDAMDEADRGEYAKTMTMKELRAFVQGAKHKPAGRAPRKKVARSRKRVAKAFREAAE